MEPVLIARENTPLVLQLVGEEMQDVIDELPSPDCYFPKVVQDLATATRQLWILPNENYIQGWMVTKIELTPLGQRILILDLMGGKDADKMIAALPTIEMWAVNLGATEVRALVRPALRKKLCRLNFHHKCDMVTKSLTGQLH